MPAIWLVIAFAAAIIEALTQSFGFLFVAVAAVFASLAASLHLPLAGQLVVFSVVLVLTIVFLRPRLMPKRIHNGVMSRTERLVGLAATVTEHIDPVLGTGRVLVAGEDWAARAGSPIAAGVEVMVKGSDGIHLMVSPVE